jgi:hypothetical protein
VCRRDLGDEPMIIKSIGSLLQSFLYEKHKNNHVHVFLNALVDGIAESKQILVRSNHISTNCLELTYS